MVSCHEAFIYDVLWAWVALLGLESQDFCVMNCRIHCLGTLSNVDYVQESRSSTDTDYTVTTEKTIVAEKITVSNLDDEDRISEAECDGT